MLQSDYPVKPVMYIGSLPPLFSTKNHAQACKDLPLIASSSQHRGWKECVHVGGHMLTKALTQLSYISLVIMSVGSNAMIVSRTMGVDLKSAYQLLSMPIDKLNAREKVVRERLDAMLQSRSATAKRVEDTQVIRMPKAPDNPPAMSVEEMARAVVDAGFKIVDSIPDVRTSKKSVIYVSPYSNPILPVDAVVVGQILQAGSFHTKWKSEMAGLLQQCTQLIVSGGTQKAWLNRLHSGFSKEVECKLPAWAGEELFDVLDTILPWEAGPTTSLSFDGRRNVNYSPNLLSGYGLPYPEYTKRDDIPYDGVHKKNALLLMYEQAEEILSHLGGGEESFNKFASTPTGRAYLAVMMKNKVEMMKRENWDKKVRPYGCFSAPLAYLYSVYWAAYSNGVVQAAEDNRSMSMIGHSWIGGGAQKYVRIIQSVEPGDCRLMAYADDFFIVVVTVKGVIFLLFPDVQQMDTSIGAAMGGVVGRVAHVRLESQNMIETEDDQPDHFPPDYQAVGAAWRHSAFKPDVVFPKGVTARPRSSHLISGVPGTSRVDEIASAVYIGDCMEKGTFIMVEDREDLDDRIKDFLQIGKNLGLIVKPDTVTPQVWKEGDMILGPILGQSLVFNKELGEYIPSPKPERCIASLIYPKQNIPKALDRIAYSMIVAMGVAVGGAAAHEVVYEACKAVWEFGRSQNIMPDLSQINEVVDAGFEKADFSAMVFGREEGVSPFPERSVFLHMMSSEYKVPDQNTHNLLSADLLEELEQKIQALESGDWADQDEAETLERQVKGGVANEKAKPLKRADKVSGFHIPFDPPTHKPGQRPEDPEARKRNNARLAAKKEHTTKEKRATLAVDKDDKKKTPREKRQAHPEKSRPQQEYRVKTKGGGSTVLTQEEQDEKHEADARVASGAISNARKRITLARLKRLEDELLRPDLTPSERDRMFAEIDELDKALQDQPLPKQPP